MKDTITKIRQQLAPLSPIALTIEDDSALHQGHAGARAGGGHYRVRIVSESFRGLSRLACHRLVYTALGSLMHQDIHALQLDTEVPSVSLIHPIRSNLKDTAP